VVTIDADVSFVIGVQVTKVGPGSVIAWLVAIALVQASHLIVAVVTPSPV
jgi:hypothetical protein